MRKTKVGIFIITLVLLLSISVIGFAVGKGITDIDTKNQITVTNVKISLGGQALNIPSKYGYPFIDNQSRTMIPLRIISESLGHKVEWNQATKTATIDGSVHITIGNNVVQTPNGEVIMDTKAILKDTRTYVPLRFVVEALGYEVKYDGPKYSNGHNHMVDIFKEGMVITPKPGTEEGNGFTIKTPSGDIFVNLDTDIHPDYKNIRPDKAKEIEDAVIKSMVYKENKDHFTFDFYQPELPEGFHWIINAEAKSKSGQYSSFYNSELGKAGRTQTSAYGDPNVKINNKEEKVEDISLILVHVAIAYKDKPAYSTTVELKTGRKAFGPDEYLFEDNEINRVSDFYLPQFKK